jgi:serine/threonine-protein kinase
MPGRPASLAPPPAQQAYTAPSPGISQPQARGSRTPAAEGEDRVLPQTFFVGRYRVVDEIGVGGMASVHLARVDGPGGFQKWVAIKRIHPHLVEDDQFVDMFLDEARIAAGINHANVAQVFDLGKDDNTYWIAMEYLHGEPLREMMRKVEEFGTQVPFHIAARICADAAEGLHGAHELRGRNGQLLNLVHRDVTPHNLFVTYEGYTKVVDFGIAKVVDRLASTRAGTLKGKLAYMSPEQVRGQEVDRRTDIFALGVVLWELTTNRRLFRMETDLDTLEKVQACVVPLPSTLVAGYPPELEAVVMRALAQRREDRFQTAREFSRALQASLMRQGLMVGPEDVGEYLKSLFTDRVRKRERYLEWAAEVTGAVDLSQLQAQAENSPSLLTPGTPSASHVKEKSQPPPAPERPQVQMSSGRDYAAAQVVTSAPLRPQLAPPSTDLASSSLMDEDEDIPTQVAGEAHMQMAMEAVAPAGGGANWGASTQLLDGDDQGGLGSTIALPGGANSFTPAPQQSFSPAVPPPGGGFPTQPPMQPMQPTGQQPYGAQMMPTDPAMVRPNQAVIETKMNLPRPAAVAQYLAEQGDIVIPGPRSTAVLIAITLLATLCVIGVGSLVVHKLTLPLQPPESGPASVSPASDGRGAGASDTASARDGSKNADASKDAATSEARADASDKPAASAAPAGAADAKAPGKLTIECLPACDSVVAAGRSLGPSPVVAAPVPPGAQRVTVRRGNQEKTIVVNIESGQLTSQTVRM